MRLLGYIRVSTEEQGEEGHSLAAQDMQLHRYGELYDHDIVDVIVDDGISAGIELEKRPGGRQLMDRLRDGEADGVIISDLDRMFRLTLDGLMTFAWFDRAGLVVHSVNDQIDTTTARGKRRLRDDLSDAEFERDKVRERTRNVLIGMRRQGLVYGPVPYGCLKEGGRLYRDIETWAVREMILTLAHVQGLSLRAIAGELYAQAIPAPGGGRHWHASTLKGILDTHHDLEHIEIAREENETIVSQLPGGQAVQAGRAGP